MSKLEPIVWEVFDNFKVRDIKLSEHEEVIGFVWKYSISKCPVYDSIGSNKNLEIKKAFECLHRYILKSECSLVVVDSLENEKICGVILQCPMLQNLKSWTNLKQIPNIDNVMIFIEIFRHLIKDYQEKTKRLDTFHIFDVIVPPYMKGDNWKIKLFGAAYRVAASIMIPRLTFIALLKEDQIRAERFKFEDNGKIFYPNYVEPISNQLIFNAFYKAHTKEQYIILYDKEVVPAQRYKDMVPLLPESKK